MSTKTYFKRIALVVVAVLGMGVLGTSGPANAAIPTGSTISVGSATATAAVGETATTTVTTTFVSTGFVDSATINTTCSLSTGGSCGSVVPSFYWGPTADSNTSTVISSGGQNIVGDTVTIVNATDTTKTLRAVVNMKVVVPTTAAVGTYTYTVFLNIGSVSLKTVAPTIGASTTFTLTVTAANTTVSSLQTYFSQDVATGRNWYDYAGTAGSKESSVVLATTSADASTAAPAAYIWARGLNSAGESITTGYSSTPANGTNICSSGCALTVTVSGPGLVGIGVAGAAATFSGAAKSKTWTIKNGADYMTSGVLQTGALPSGGSGETLTVYADGTAGTSTVNVYRGIVLLKSFSITFTGAAASAPSVGLSETSVAVGSTTNVLAQLKDAAGNVLKAGTVYVYASDTKTISSGATSTNATQFTQLAAGVKKTVTDNTATGKCTNYDSTLGLFSCSVTVNDTGTATLTVRDSFTVAASTFASSALTVTGVGKAATYAITFDKASYTAGEQALITITGKDLAGVAASAQKNALAITTSLSLGNGGNSLSTGTNGAVAVTSKTTYAPFRTGSVWSTETLVVMMPANSGTFTLTIKTTPESTNPDVGSVSFTGSATVTDPAEVAANAAIAAAKAAETAAKAAETAAVAAANAAKADAVAAADAATDAALQAIDAANAATDAANLAAEAADAATVAAEEAKDAADAATAAVEALATQVATLMAALQAQVRSLANTVAKIAKKVKA